MLVFRRQAGESFLVGDHVEVRILEVNRGQVKIGVVAPREVGIYRSEVSRLNRRSAVEDLKQPEVQSALAALGKAFRERKDQ